MLERRVYLAIRPKRYRCPHCEGRPTTTQRCDWYDPNSPHTKAFEKWVLRCLVNSTVVDVSQKLGLGPDAVDSILGRWVSTTGEWHRLTTLETLGIDEIALTRGHGNYVALISTRDARGHVAVLAVLPDRLRATVKGFLEAIPTPLKATIQTVCMDMYDGYVKAVEEALPGVTVVVDRFHVAQHYHACVDQLRKQELKRLQQELPEADYEPLKGLLWLVRQDWTTLSQAEQDRLLPLVRQSPALEQAYCWRHVLTGIFNSSFTKARASEAIAGWCEQVQVHGLRCFEGVLTTLANWREEITNYFLQRQNSGFVEGLNNKLKVLKRRCYGLDSVKTCFQRLQLDLEGYRWFAMG
ncbi:MAG TPA: ISL3 family transposase [Candidatus Competibacteraceae bacterium]|nr:ISL3 family transposase [Candidatus Competibacteraceae bacterium]